MFGWRLIVLLVHLLGYRIPAWPIGENSPPLSLSPRSRLPACAFFRARVCDYGAVRFAVSDCRARFVPAFIFEHPNFLPVLGVGVSR